MDEVQSRESRYGEKVCEDWANLLMNEKVQITLEGQKEQAFVDSVLTENNFTVKANEMQEMKSALGTVAYIPRVVGQAVNESGETVPGDVSGIALDYVTIEHIFPLAWQNGFISECAFDSVVTRTGKTICICRFTGKTKTDFTSSRTAFTDTKTKRLPMRF